MKNSILTFFFVNIGNHVLFLFKCLLQIRCIFWNFVKKSLKFILSRKNGIIVFKSNFIFLSAKVDLISKKQSCKKEVFMVYSISCIKIIIILLTKVVKLYL